jgi:hypothetical protein
LGQNKKFHYGERTVARPLPTLPRWTSITKLIENILQANYANSNLYYRDI